MKTDELDSTASDEIAQHSEDNEIVESELLVEEVSIDGMCGVY
ncbi:mycofactocin precursor MftA [Streptomyces sp. NRRL F-2747]|nr:mycofactocin precursor MftA [Streptomyces sp. NRRL F-2747]